MLCYKGFALCELGRFKEAEDLFAKVLKREPDHLLALINISERYLVKGELDKGIRYAKKALNISNDEEFKILARYLMVAGYFLKNQETNAFSELKRLLDFRKTLDKKFQITDWNFAPLVSVIKQKLPQKNKKILLSLIEMLKGRMSIAKFEEIITQACKAVR